MSKMLNNRTDMPLQAVKTRIKNFNEVALGYTDDMAKTEASRCLQCKKLPCVSGCPVGIKIPEFIKAIRDDNLAEAVNIIKQDNILPGICGRVCPQETQCENNCVLKKSGNPIAIGRLERFTADWERKNRNRIIKTKAIMETGKSVAVVGSGPAGLTAAADLARMGHSVTVIDALHTAGGVLKYGIPDFRLPSDMIDEDVEKIGAFGVVFQLNTLVGQTQTVDELLEIFDAVFLGTGAGLPIFLNIPGENLIGVYSANEFLTRINLMQAYRFPDYHTPVKTGKQVAVIGGGNVAMDAARCSLRLGAEKVYVIYRRSEIEMPARHEEVEHAIEEGVDMKFLTSPVRFIGDDKRNLKMVQCIQMELGEPDASGRRKPLPVEGSEFSIDIDVAIIALGTTPNPLISQTALELRTSSKGTLVYEESTGRTTKPRVWAGGDVATGSATVISAMGAARCAAADIDRFLKNPSLEDKNNWLTES